MPGLRRQRRHRAPRWPRPTTTTAAVARHLVMFTVGTGVGGGDRHRRPRLPRRDRRGGRARPHDRRRRPRRTAPPSRRRAFPQPGSLEALASGRALDALGRERGFEDGREVVDAARRPATRQALRGDRAPRPAPRASASPTRSTRSTPSSSSSAAASRRPATCCSTPRARPRALRPARRRDAGPRSASPATARGRRARRRAAGAPETGPREPEVPSPTGRAWARPPTSTSAWPRITAAGDERLARPDPPLAHREAASCGAWSRRTRCAA